MTENYERRMVEIRSRAARDHIVDQVVKVIAFVSTLAFWFVVIYAAVIGVMWVAYWLRGFTAIVRPPEW